MSREEVRHVVGKAGVPLIFAVQLSVWSAMADTGTATTLALAGAVGYVVWSGWRARTALRDYRQRRADRVARRLLDDRRRTSIGVR